MPILNDLYYPQLQAQQGDNYSKPLQLLAKSFNVIDPLTQQARSFTYPAELTFS